MSEYMDDFWSLDSIKNWFSGDSPVESGTLWAASDESGWTTPYLGEMSGVIPSVTQNLPVSSNDLSFGKVWDGLLGLTKQALPSILDSPGVSGVTKQYVERVNADGTITRVPTSTGGVSSNMGLIVAVAVVGIGAIYLLRK